MRLSFPTLLVLFFLCTATEAQTLGDLYDGEDPPQAQENNPQPENNPPPQAEPENNNPPMDKKPATNLRWASSGGGWRAMFGAMGFANVFQQAGLFSADSSEFSAISTNSGSSWFATQLFYSPNFYNLTVLSTPEELYNFSLGWMGTYEGLSDWVYGENEMCNVTGLGDTPTVQAFSELCELTLKYDGDWATFIATMLLAASTWYGDVTLVNRTVTAENRIAPLKHTDMFIMTALGPASKIRYPVKVPVPIPAANEHEDPFDRKLRKRDLQLIGQPDDTIVYIGPKSDSGSQTLYTTSQGAAFVVNDDGQDFYYMSDSKNGSDFQLYKASTPHAFDVGDFEDFWGSGEVTIDNNVGLFNNVWGDYMEGVTLREPFGGQPKVHQIASISSAAVGGMSPASPISYALSMENSWAKIRDGLGPITLIPGRVAFNIAANRVYKSPMMDTIAVCSQYPRPCDERDGWFIDGGKVENYALSATISQYQLEPDYDDSEPLKIILTNTNQYWIWEWDLKQLLRYFDSSYTKGIKPGGFMGDQRSPQIFEDFMDLELLNTGVERISGSNMTTIRMDLTTIDNRPFGVQGGLAVELLMINLNEDITTFVGGPSIIANTTDAHAEMTYKIATNEVLVQRVRDFYGGPGTDEEIQK